VATGSAPWVPAIPGLGEAGFLTSATALDLGQVPESVILLGGNTVGLELAQLFARLGSRVTVVEALDRLAPFGEPEISAGIEAVLRDDDIAVRTGVTATEVSRDEGGCTVTLAVADRVDQVRAGQLLVATGRCPVTAGLNLGAVGAKTGDWGEVAVDDQLRTNNPRVWAAGDVTGGPQFVYVAAAQGALAVGNALAGTGRTLDYAALPRVTFTSPAIASAGMTDAQAAAAGIACDCRVLPLEYVPRALVNRDTRGLVKIVAEAATSRLLGVHALAGGAGELITAASCALTAGMTVRQLADAWVPYLTMAEALRLAAQTYTRDVSKLSCCAACSQ
jgi:mercuric reductase